MKPPWMEYRKGWSILIDAAVRSIPCPFCHVGSGEPCVGVMWSGKSKAFPDGTPKPYYHSPRKKAAGVVVNALNKVRFDCPLCGGEVNPFMNLTHRCPPSKDAPAPKVHDIAELMLRELARREDDELPPEDDLPPEPEPPRVNRYVVRGCVQRSEVGEGVDPFVMAEARRDEMVVEQRRRAEAVLGQRVEARVSDVRRDAVTHTNRVSASAMVEFVAEDGTSWRVADAKQLTWDDEGGEG